MIEPFDGGVLRSTLKEWDVAVRALRRGEAIITVRKGGIREDGREFRMEHRRFAFFPTYEHQSAEQLRPEYRASIEDSAAKRQPDVLRIDTWAEVTDVIEVHEQRAVAALGRFYVFSEQYAIERLQWRPRKPLHVLLLRVCSLPTAYEFAMEPGFGGCKSWIELEHTIALEGSSPALSDAQFSRLRADALAALHGESED